jgi:hypothetical protein
MICSFTERLCSFAKSVSMILERAPLFADIASESVSSRTDNEACLIPMH